jgi:hypothetical protein
LNCSLNQLADLIIIFFVMASRLNIFLAVIVHVQSSMTGLPSPKGLNINNRMFNKRQQAPRANTNPEGVESTLR